jgi:hypothetical protein
MVQVGIPGLLQGKELGGEELEAEEVEGNDV